MHSIDLPRSRLTLEARAIALVRHLGGRWTGSAGLCRCPAHADRSPSLSVRIGDSDLLFKCFAGCDTIAVLRAIARLDPAPVQRPCDATIAAPADAAWLRHRARDLWAEAGGIGNTPAESYLRNRSIDRLSPALRYHPNVPLGPYRLRLFRPALIAAVTEATGLVALQRTFLDPRAARRARDLGNPRRMLGRPGTGAVRLAAATDTLGLAEGVETALSAMILLDIPVWAVLGNERLARVSVPSRVDRLVLLPDHDRPGRRAETLARAAHARPGRTIETLWPWRGLNDWNDVLRQEGERGGAGVRQVA